MQNKKILYILTFILTLFSFNNNVNAAQELTCVYDKGGASNKIILIQESNGKRELWAHSEDASIDSSGWEKDKYTIDITRVSSEKLDGSNNLLSCPSYANAPSVESKVDFFDDYNFWKDFFNFNKWFPQSLDTNESEKKVKRPTTAQTSDSDDSKDGKGNLIKHSDLDKTKYQATCKYARTIEDGEYAGQKHYVQVSFGQDDSGENHILLDEYDPAKGKYSGKEKGSDTQTGKIESFPVDIPYTYLYEYTFKASTKFTADYFLEYMGEHNGECPIYISVDREYKVQLNDTISDIGIITSKGKFVFINTTLYIHDDEAKKGVLYNKIGSEGTNPLTGEELSENGVPNITIDFEKVNIENCKELLGEEIAGYFNIAWNIVKMGVPIILLGMGTVDFAQAVFAGKEDGMKKATEKFTKRVIIAIVIFLVPTLIGFLLKIANNVWGGIGTDICGIIF